MRRSVSLRTSLLTLAALAVASLLFLGGPTEARAGCLGGIVGKVAQRVTHPFGGRFGGGAQASACYSPQAGASACYSPQARYGAGACYGSAEAIEYRPVVQYRIQAFQACGPQGCAVQSTAQTYQYLQAPSKATPQAAPQAVPPLPAKTSPQGTSEAAPPPPLAPDAVEPVVVLALPMPPPPDEPVPAPVVVVETDPYGYQSHLNGFRARFGLRPLRYNANLSAWAYQNSLRGFGHTVRMGRRQNAAWGQRDAATVERDWEGSPGHRDALLDAQATDYGIAVASNVWTLNIN